VTDKIVILSTCETDADARRIAAYLVEQRLAACVSIVPGATSVYRWKGKIESSSEFMLVIKSRRDLVRKIWEAFVTLHPYDTPELIALPIVDGSPIYLDWLDESLSHETKIT
jgi:periplasmic divalent cation tolerance protein